MKCNKIESDGKGVWCMLVNSKPERQIINSMNPTPENIRIITPLTFENKSANSEKYALFS